MNSPRKGRRTFAGVALALTAGLGITACSAGTSDTGTSDAGASGSSDAPVELRFAYWGAESRIASTDAIIAAFEAENPNITVKGEYADWSGYWDKLATSTAGGDSPDIVQMDQLYLASYADRGTLADLLELPVDLGNLQPAVLGTGQWQGTQYALPVSTVGHTVLVNMDVLDELGVELPDTDTWTWDEFGDFAAEVTEASGGSIVGAEPPNNSFSLDLWTRQHGESTFTDGNVSITPETLAGYLELGHKWSQQGGVAEASRYSEQVALPIDQIDFSTGTQATTFRQSTQLSAFVASTGGANIIAVKLPTDDANAAKYNYYKPGMYLGVSSQSDHQEEAAMFIDFMLNNPTAAPLLGTDRGIPANPVTLESIKGSLSPEQLLAVEYDQSLVDTLGEAPEIVPNGAAALDSLIQRYILEVLFEQSTAEDAANAFIDELQSSIDAA